uniref:Uncharacterized protein n=1 Tax=Rhipicephalus appendiculatus TaxID=34631 RepID=A0A131YY63_RHIAP
MFNWCSAGSAVQIIKAYLLIAIILGLACEFSHGVCPAPSHRKTGKMCYSEGVFFCWCISPASCAVEKKMFGCYKLFLIGLVRHVCLGTWCIFIA